MSRTVQLHVGINGQFCAARWEQPDSWVRLTRELGFRWHELSGDLLDPLYGGDRQFQTEVARQAKKAARAGDVAFCAVDAGIAPRCSHGLSHTHAIPRQTMVEWVVAAMSIARELGARRVTGHWDSIPVETLEQGEDAAKKAIRSQYEIIRDLARIGGDMELSGLCVEQSYVPARTPCTIKQAEEMLIATNRNNPGCPVHVTVNVGHMAGAGYGLEGRDLDYLEWLKALAAFSPIIHLQQTKPDVCCNWPFTDEYNQQGHIELGRVIEAIQWGHEHWEESWVSEVMEPIHESWLILKVIPPLNQTETSLLEDLGASAAHIEQSVPGGRTTLNV